MIGVTALSYAVTYEDLFSIFLTVAKFQILTEGIMCVINLLTATAGL